VLVVLLVGISTSTTTQTAQAAPCTYASCPQELEKLLVGDGEYSGFFDDLVFAGDGGDIEAFMEAGRAAGLMPGADIIAADAGAFADAGAGAGIDAVAAAGLGEAAITFALPLAAAGVAVYLAYTIDWSHVFNGWAGPILGPQHLDSVRYFVHDCVTVDICPDGTTAYVLAPIPYGQGGHQTVPAGEVDYTGGSIDPYLNVDDYTCANAGLDSDPDNCTGGGPYAEPFAELQAIGGAFADVATASPGFEEIGPCTASEGIPLTCYGAWVPNAAELLAGTGALTGADVTTSDPTEGAAIEDWPGECSAGAGSGECVTGSGAVAIIDAEPGLGTAIDTALGGTEATEILVPDCDGSTYIECVAILRDAGLLGTITRTLGDPGTEGDDLLAPNMVQQLTPATGTFVAPDAGLDVKIYTNEDGSDPSPGDGTGTGSDVGGGVNAGGPEGGGCTAPTIPALDFSPLNVPIGDKFPFALFAWISGVASSLAVTGEAPTFTIPIDVGPVNDDLTVDLSSADEMMSFLRPILAGFTILGAIVFVSKGALGFGASAPTATGE
jgi:hypothetical protein